MKYTDLYRAISSDELSFLMMQKNTFAPTEVNWGYVPVQFLTLIDV